MRDLDINQIPVEEGEDREWMIKLSMSNNNNNSSAEMEEDQDVDDRTSNGEGGGGGGAASGSSPPRKKLRLSKEQSRQLEESFRRNQTLNPKQKEELATHLKLKARQVEVWFQNRRARSKLKQTEIECDYLKRWFASLTERNRRLQKEVEQLRALKVAGPSAALSTAQSQASTLTMCPRCERVADTSQPTAATSASAAAKLPERSRLLPATWQPPPAAC